jgi:hypothetical protein
VRAQEDRLDRLEHGAELIARDLRARDGVLLVTLVNVGRGECHQATVVAATHGRASAPVEVGGLPPARLGYPGTVVEIPSAALGAVGAHALWLRIAMVDDLGLHRTNLRIAPGVLSEAPAAAPVAA